MKKQYTWIVQMQVASEWVADGFALTDERALRMLASDCDFADMSTELSAKVIASPSPLKIAREQGYGPKHAHAGEVVREIRAGTPLSGALDKALIDAIDL